MELSEGLEKLVYSEPISKESCDRHACIWQNMLYNNGRWYGLTDGNTSLPVARLSKNMELVYLHARNATKWLQSVSWEFMPGNTLLMDYTFYTHPFAIGHWWEMVGPMYSTLKRHNMTNAVDRLLVLHLQRQHMIEWVRTMLAVMLGVDRHHGELPPLYIQRPVSSGWALLSSLFDGLQPDTWYLFEKVIITKDLTMNGTRTFETTEHAREFRELVYKHFDLPSPTQRQQVPKLITFQRKRANRRIINEAEVIALLETYSPVEVVEYNISTPFYEQLAQMQRTGVYVSVHTSNLANAPFLQSGSAVVELLQRNWWKNGMDKSFKIQSDVLGDIHHFAWRAHYLNQTEYLNPRDKAKVGHWLTSECQGEECVEAHTRVDIRVDIQELKELLDSRLPLVFNGTSVKDADIPWPPTKDVPEDTILED